MRLIAEKNVHELIALCTRFGIAEEKAGALVTVVRAYGKMEKVLPMLENVCVTQAGKAALLQLKTVCDLLKTNGYAKQINLDFSVVNDMKYYNGFVFKGFVSGICEGVLSGGQYDTLMARMGRNTGAIGFAVYLDLLENLQSSTEEYDLDEIVLYDENTDVSALIEKLNAAVANGEKISAQKTRGNVRAKHITNWQGGRKDD